MKERPNRQQSKVLWPVIGYAVAISASVIAGIILDAYALNVGYKKGYDAGYIEGENDGFEQFMIKRKDYIREQAKKYSCEQKFEKETQAARNEGFINGKDQGYKEGLEKGRLESQQQLAKYKEDSEIAKEKVKKALEKFSYYLMFFEIYKNDAEKLATKSRMLLQKPDNKEQQLLNAKLRAMVNSVRAERQGAGIYQQELNSELDKLAEALEKEDAKSINLSLITLKDTLPFKFKKLTSQLSTLRENISKK